MRVSCFKVAIVVTMAVVGLVPAHSVHADDTKIEVTDANFIKSGLEKLAGKTVTLRIAGSEDISGIVESVGPSAVRIGQLTGKEFYSAVVALDSISAVIYRAK